MTPEILKRTITIRGLLDLAACLCSEDSENSEYDRALAELVCDAAGLSMEEVPNVLAAIRQRADANQARLTAPREK